MPSTLSLRFIKMCSVLIVTSLYMYSWGLHVRNNNDIVECNGLHWNNLSYNGLSLANYCVLCFTPGVALATHETFNYIPSQRAWRLTGSAQLADLSLLREVVPLHASYFYSPACVVLHRSYKTPTYHEGSLWYTWLC